LSAYDPGFNFVSDVRDESLRITHRIRMIFVGAARRGEFAAGWRWRAHGSAWVVPTLPNNIYDDPFFGFFFHPCFLLSSDPKP
jgi:hypothetical protein